MKEQNAGGILNASSVVGHLGNFDQSNYAASKFGIIGLTKKWMKELGRCNIHVNAVAPALILMEMPEMVLKAMEEKSVLNHLGEPADVAKRLRFPIF